MRRFQKVSLGIAWLSYGAAVACAALAVYMGLGSDDPVVASVMASVVFFVGAGVVLHVMARCDLPDLRIER